MLTIESVAKICYEANKAYCEGLGDCSQVPWSETPDWQRKSAKSGVIFHTNNPSASPAASHDSWLKEKEADGWVYGGVKCADKKEHPCIVPFDELPVEQQAKDILFRNIVDIMRSVGIYEHFEEPNATI